MVRMALSDAAIIVFTVLQKYLYNNSGVYSDGLMSPNITILGL